MLTICDLLDEIVPKEKSYREQITYVADRQGMIAVMQLMPIKLAANWAGNHRKRLRAGFAKRWNGIWLIQIGLRM